jgi:hypothetical protein
MAEIYKLFDELRRVMVDGGETPQGQMVLAILQLDERLREVEAWMERTKEYDREQLER